MFPSYSFQHATIKCASKYSYLPNISSLFLCATTSPLHLTQTMRLPSDDFCSHSPKTTSASLNKKELTYVFPDLRSRTPPRHLWHFQTSTQGFSAVRCLPHIWDKLPYKHQKFTAVHNFVPIQTKSRSPQTQVACRHPQRSTIKPDALQGKG